MSSSKRLEPLFKDLKYHKLQILKSAEMGKKRFSLKKYLRPLSLYFLFLTIVENVFIPVLESQQIFPMKQNFKVFKGNHQSCPNKDILFFPSLSVLLRPEEAAHRIQTKLKKFFEILFSCRFLLFALFGSCFLFFTFSSCFCF